MEHSPAVAPVPVPSAMRLVKNRPTGRSSGGRLGRVRASQGEWNQNRPNGRSGPPARFGASPGTQYPWRKYRHEGIDGHAPRHPAGALARAAYRWRFGAGFSDPAVRLIVPFVPRAAAPTSRRASSPSRWGPGWGRMSSSRIAAGRAAPSGRPRSRRRRPMAALARLRPAR